MSTGVSLSILLLHRQSARAERLARARRLCGRHAQRESPPFPVGYSDTDTGAASDRPIFALDRFFILIFLLLFYVFIYLFICSRVGFFFKNFAGEDWPEVSCCKSNCDLCTMRPRCLLSGLCVLVLLRAAAAYECAPCHLRTCPLRAPRGCGNARTLARDPCGCCDRCARLEREPCGGRDWALGYCALGLTCASTNRSGAAAIPEVGVCTALPDYPDAGMEDERCPLISGCDRTGGQCVCDSRHTCLATFSYPNKEACIKAAKSEGRRHEREHKERPKEKFVGPVDPGCVSSGCNLTAEGCVCESQTCHAHFTYANRSQCQQAAGSPRCSHNGKEFAEGEVYRMDPCWLCRCRGGISFCSKAECAKLDCDNFYTPEGECCPVCVDVDLLSVAGREASCWVNHKLRVHEEQWKEDDCTFCQCLDGEAHCTAMACKQSCHNPIKIPGECCPFCEEPSYETVSPLLCPPLENCSLSGSDCPFGFQQDQSGCLLCQCLNNNSCPDLARYCLLSCPMGYEKDDFGCDVCECSQPMPKCRPLTCAKTCSYGYVRNKHGCEMCRCVKCAPFTCDKHCSEGYQQNKKGCSICFCKENALMPSTTTASVNQYCLTANGHRYEEGESWHDGCRDCYCHAGHEMCVLISCPVPTCAQPVVRPHQCCPTCEEESGSGQSEGTDLVVCRAPGGELYVDGEMWNLDECTRCTCKNGRVLCDTEVCPPALCQTPARSKDTCCHVCPEDKLLPVNGSQRDYCISSDGDMLMAGDSWKANACTSCTCRNGSIQCFSQHCPPAHCRVPVLRKGQCCPHCLEATTTSVPMLLSTTTTTKPKTTTTENQVVWITTDILPPIIAATDGKSLGEEYPTQAEIAMIYQSAAWILAGLLLTIIFFLITALLINKKKKWVQMSCYSAPKKTVILKKHVNNNSVVYMEPSKENKFQNVKKDCGMNFSPEMSNPGGERITIPRAKLSNGHGRV
ncbi:cysteine-rich motor neuron 1 protein isoform X2 [Denticeps clupeoides]|uniref:cysteine-rich motor neuron 1 protein isoform X2 n=1 Tax=Denticeps clupeoides TaxID=299321 RepID=UPI0010A33B41|nr:cysteine-rich motor neuron 1 protein-like isoform X2 [Denticeps clupeoides]